MKNETKCSFCNRNINDLSKVIEAQGCYICSDCVNICSKLLKNHDEAKLNVIEPKKIYSELNKYIIGQEDAKKVLSVAVYNHYKKIKNKSKFSSKKSNILLIGSSGSGKTLMAETLSKIIDVPIAICDATTLTEAGYVGEDVENIVLRLIESANYDVKKAEKGIIYLDEFDKLAKKSENVSVTRDVSGEGVQQALLKLIEGSIINVPPKGGRKHPYQDCIKVNTKDILFICGGAFVGLDKIISERKKTKTIGFLEKNIDINANIESEDLVKYGLIPEIIGRLPVIAELKKLSINDLIDILTKPKDAILDEYKNIMEVDGVKVTFTNEAIKTIAEYAYNEDKGARGLRAIIENIMLDIMFEIPKKSVIIDEGYIISRLNNKKNINLHIS